MLLAKVNRYTPPTPLHPIQTAPLHLQNSERGRMGSSYSTHTHKINKSVSYLSPSMFKKNGSPPVSSEQWLISPRHVLMVASVVESLGTPHRRSHSIKWISLSSHHSRNAGTTLKSTVMIYNHSKIANHSFITSPNHFFVSDFSPTKT